VAARGKRDRRNKKRKIEVIGFEMKEGRRGDTPLYYLGSN
jgi:hypothetical protein